MTQIQNFTWDIFINMVDRLTGKNTEIEFTKLEKQLLECYWYNLERQDIFKVLDAKRAELKFYYKDCFFSMGLEPNIMNKLSRLIERTVNKNNFKEVFKHIWERDNRANFSRD